MDDWFTQNAPQQAQTPPPKADWFAANAPSKPYAPGSIEAALSTAKISPPEPGIGAAINRFKERVRGAMGADVKPAGDVIGGAVLGPMTVAHGITQIPEHPVRATNEMVRGVGQTVALPMAVANPAMMAYAGPSIMAQQGTQKGLEALGVDKDYAELGGNVAGALTGAAVAKPQIAGKLVKSVGAMAKPLGNLPILDKITKAVGSIKDVPGDLKDIWTQDSKPAPQVVEAVKALDDPSKPLAKIIDIQNRYVQPGPREPVNLLPQSQAGRGFQGEFKVSPAAESIQAAAESKAMAVPTGQENTVNSLPKAPIKKVMSTDPKTRVTLGDPAQSGDYSVSPVMQGGREVGRLVYQIDGDRATVHWLGDSAMKNSLSNQLGPVGLKQIFMKFAKQNPDVKALQGIRVGGASGDEAMSVVYDISDLYGKSPQQNLVPTHQRQLAGQPGRVPVTHTPAPAEPMTVPTGPVTEPRVPVNDEDMTNLLMESLRQIKAKRGQ